MSADSIIELVEKMKHVAENEMPIALAKKGSEKAQEKFGNMTAVHLDCYTFGISGTSAMIAEFGAGSKTDSGHKFAKDMEFPVQRGSYSDAHHGEYARSGYKEWTFGGQPYKYVTPRRGMYFGMREMQNNILNTFREEMQK